MSVILTFIFLSTLHQRLHQHHQRQGKGRNQTAMNQCSASSATVLTKFVKLRNKGFNWQFKRNLQMSSKWNSNRKYKGGVMSRSTRVKQFNTFFCRHRCGPQKTSVYICLVLIVLISCIAVVAIALAVVALGHAKEAKDSSEQLQQTPDPCSSAPCSNGGTCLPFPADNYTCVCSVSDFW